MLAHADSSGWVDIHPRAIAEEVGLTIEQVQAAIDELEAPDPESRSPEHEGRRIIRLDDHRAWGWAIVNHAKYRAIRSEEDRREQNRLAQQRWREKNNQSKPRKPESAQAEAEAEASKPYPPSEEGKTGKPVCPPCPIEEIIKVYHEALPTNPRFRVRNATRDGYIRSRWQQFYQAGDFQDKEKGLQCFRWFFDERVKPSKFLTGQAEARNGSKPFIADLEWLMRPTNFAKVIEGKYQ